ncbi:hypothetical protein B0H63DRAFT_172515 [Podospora didyma]|uniref:Uncharacterized protein n=1 Tax=Podospora didyma TaxID=330526 RepID=A0AAE0TZ60_9PEZI|nr:hypothetical protein B0H63DRAFT_172515 [Podospora didyma]
MSESFSTSSADSTLNADPSSTHHIKSQLWRHTVRQLRLDGIYILAKDIFTKPRSAKGHVAIYKDRRAAAISAFVHLLGVFGVATLGYLILHEMYIGSELQGSLSQDSQKLLALLMTAKIFELIAVFSLSSIVFTLVRYEMVLGNGAPLAALGAGLQISDPTFLVSKAMVAITTGQFSSRWKKLGFVILIAYFTILAILIAPASATALMPRLDTWRVGGTTLWWNASEAALFPAVLDETFGPAGTNCSVTGNVRCPYHQWDAISTRLLSHLPKTSQMGVFEVSSGLDGYLLPETLVIDGRETALQMTSFVRGEDYHVFTAPHTISSMAHGAVVDGLVKATAFWQRASLRSLIEKETIYHRNRLSTFNIDVKTAVTHTRCNGWLNYVAKLGTTQFPDLTTLGLDDVDVTDPMLTNWLVSALRNLTAPQILWFDPTSNIGNASIGALLAIPNHEPTNQTATVYGCMIDARWANTILTADHTARTASGSPEGFVLGANIPPEKRWIHDPNYGSRVRITPGFAKLINPLVAGTKNLTLLQELLRQSGSWDPTSKRYKIRPLNWVEAVLGTMITNGMARSSPDVGPVTTLKDVDGTWWRNFLPQGGSVYGPGGEAFAITEKQKGEYFSLEMEAWAEGYGYGRSDLTILLSMACLGVYAVSVLVFVVWSVSSGITSTSWDTVLELVAIALKSPPPAKGKMEGVSAGIMTAQPLRQRYCMSADEDAETIRLVAVDEELDEGSWVRPNKAYW